MCQSIYFEPQKRTINTYGQLSCLIGKVNIVRSETFDGMRGRPPGHGCLCPVDIEATASKAGYVCRPDQTGDPMLYIWHR